MSQGFTIPRDLTITHYGALSIPFTATEREIKTAHNKHVLLTHPDKTGTNETAPDFRADQVAYEVLIDPARRRAYDWGLLVPPPPPPVPYDRTYYQNWWVGHQAEKKRNRAAERKEAERQHRAAVEEERRLREEQQVAAYNQIMKEQHDAAVKEQAEADLAKARMRAKEAIEAKKKAKKAEEAAKQ